MQKYKYILFDWDGCLAKTLEVWLQAYKDALSRRQLFPGDTEIAHHFGDWSIGSYFGVKDAEAFNIEAVAWARKELAHVELYEGAYNLLVALREQNVPMALLSSGSRDIIESGIEHNNLADVFDLIITGDDTVNHKPHPEVIETALRHFKAIPNEAVMVGDSNKDIGAAQNAGVDSILVYPDSHKLFYDFNHLKSLNPTFIVSSLLEIEDLT